MLLLFLWLTGKNKTTEFAQAKPTMKMLNEFLKQLEFHTTPLTMQKNITTGFLNIFLKNIPKGERLTQMFFAIVKSNLDLFGIRKKIGADKIATGHYAKVVEKDGKFYLYKAKDKNKDQSYFLNQLSQEQLGSVIFPLAEIEKPEVRKIAEKLELSNAKKKDSTGVCFIGERNFRNFLKNFLPAKPGQIKTTDGEVVGTHEGLMFYTLGQRRGLNIGGKKGGNGERWFVLDKDLKNNVLIVSQGEDDLLFSNGLYAKEFNWIPEVPKEKTFKCFAKFRYRQPDQGVSVEVLEGKRIKVDFDEKQRAITPGQFVVLYDENERCLGGGIIESYFKLN